VSVALTTTESVMVAVQIILHSRTDRQLGAVGTPARGMKLAMSLRPGTQTRSDNPFSYVQFFGTEGLVLYFFLEHHHRITVRLGSRKFES
jgi:hypothetical protein